MRALAVIAALAAGCRPAPDERARADLEVGLGASGDVAFEVEQGLAHIRLVDAGQLELWAGAPAFHMTATAGSAATPDWMITASNVPADALLTATVDGLAIAATDLGGPRPTVKRWQVTLPVSSTIELTIAPADSGDRAPWRFAVMGDIQKALGDVDDMFLQINQETGVRFVVSTGDLVEFADADEYEILLEQLETLEIPYYSTIGNHELFGDPDRWARLFGRFTLHWKFKGVAFSLVDSGSASIDPIVYGWLDDWLEAERDGVHVFVTHFPPIDPIGVRAGAFRSRNEASKLLAKLAAGRVDLTLYGHIHSYYKFTNAGIPARISGGGGALPEKLDGIGRHYLIVDVDPDSGVTDVSVVRVD